MEEKVEFEKTVSSIEEYLSEVFNAASNLKNNAIKNEVIFFRGNSNKDFEIIPSIARDRKFSCDISILNEERNLIETAKYRLPKIFHNDLYPIDLLALLQHYGIPTRLLDITSNPLVALYFACQDLSIDGEVIVFVDNQSDIANYPIINAIADSYKFAFTTSEDLSMFYSKILIQPYFIEQKYSLEFCGDEKQGGRWIQECCEKPMFVHAQENSTRQKLQQGKYILFPNHIVEGNGGPYFEKVIHPIPKEEKYIKKRILIPDGAKKEILNKLEVLGISESTLFADNIDTVCRTIAEDAKKRTLN
ncbi:FRG domain-containing protein [[Clostridium] fimetarium]|uniref:FRG domain-containing protein n=1 Tax=[Clostridium] fimetarium TaxID=99656 RepID=A0A1I0QWI0_9FIRM|nr:FRG domain-containing protein [[Clostridium] fimetarium]SEW31861.1 FRG domain-containing protein [[Clostridium] fimetarium]